ncbi:hypothetical protein [Algoriphagus antarcticus]
MEFHLDIISNYELERLILSYAESVKVIAPESFKKVIQDRIKASLDQYR